MGNSVLSNVINNRTIQNMKKEISIIAIILISIILCSCTNKKTGTAAKQESADTTNSNKFDYTKEGMGNILIDSVTTYKYKDIFESKIRRPLYVVNDKVSQSVWFDKDAILLLADYLRADSNNLDGVRIHFMSYEKNKTAPGQYKEHQTSLALVPTNPLPTNKYKHVDNWKILVNERYKADSILKKIGFMYGLNHGELCPQICN